MPPSRWRRLAFTAAAAAAAAYVAYQWWYADGDESDADDGGATPPPLPPDLAERSLTSWAGAAEAEAAARRRRREEAAGAGGRRGGPDATPAPCPVEVEMEAVVARPAGGGGGGDGDAGGGPPPSAPSPPPPHPDPHAAAVASAAADLDRHFASVQSICDGVTLPAAARDLSAALASVADVAGLTAKLKDGGSGGAGPPLDADAKRATWAALRDAGLTSALGAPWLVGALALALRVQLNVLGRHLFLAAHVGGDGGGGRRPSSSGGGGGAAPPPTTTAVSTAAQARLLEYGHHFVRTGAAALLAGAVKPAAVQAGTAGGLGLADPLLADDLLDRLSAAHAAVDAGVTAWALEYGATGATVTGWPALLLPPPAGSEDALLVGGGGSGGPDSPPGPALSPADEALVRGMAAELALIYASPRFATAARAAVAAVAAQTATALASALGATSESVPLPLAKAVPRAAAVGRALLDPGSPAFADAVAAVGELPEVRELCAAVYSCGPPL